MVTTVTTGTGTSERTCIVRGAAAGPEGLFRFVVDPEGRIVPDIAAKLPGRGYWVTAQRDVVDQAVRTRRFERAVARARKGTDGPPVRVDPGLGQWVEDLLVRRCLEYLGLACRAGQVVTGFEKVRAFAAATRTGAGTGVILVEAADGSDDGLRKIRQGLTPRALVRRFSREQLSLALGRENVVHAAVGVGGIGSRFLDMAERLARYAPDRSQDAGSYAGAEQGSVRQHEGIGKTV
ncbi:MAG: RNA-binding protein [Sphingomonadales bacterium]